MIGHPEKRLRCGIVLDVAEDECEVVFGDGERSSVRYATVFPSPRTERVSPGHLVAIATGHGSGAVVWRWYDAVILGEENGLVRLWEPAHGHVLARFRDPQRPRRPGTRAYLSAGLPGADWWVAGPAVGSAEDADVELAEVARFYSEHDLWDRID